jgi:hypothetical protein
MLLPGDPDTTYQRGEAPMLARAGCKGLWTLFTAVSCCTWSFTGVSPQAGQMPPNGEGPPPKITLLLKDRHGQATPTRTDAAHTAGGNTEVLRPREDTILVGMTGVVTAGPHPCRGSAAALDFTLDQEFGVVCAEPKVQKAKLTIDWQVIGLLRGDKNGGSAGVGPGVVAIDCEGICLLLLVIQTHAVNGNEYLAINDHKGPISIPVGPGEYHLRQGFRINAEHARSICGRAAAAEFAPDPTLDPTWISVTDPFRGANKKEFGFRVVLRVEPE